VKPLRERKCEPPETVGAKITCVEKETSSTPAPESRRSETLTGVLLSLGGILLLTMAFFGRIQKITLPGGASIEIVPEETQAKVAGDVGAQPEFTDDPAKVKVAYLNAMSKIRSKMLEDAKMAVAAGEPAALIVPTVPSDEFVERAIGEAINELLP